MKYRKHIIMKYFINLFLAWNITKVNLRHWRKKPDWLNALILAKQMLFEFVNLLIEVQSLIPAGKLSISTDAC